MNMPIEPFWEVVPLTAMTPEQWESLCDGCAKCCLEKLEDEDTGRIHYTNVVCRLLSLESCRCRHYAKRTKIVPNCVTLTPVVLEKPNWLPPTCAYRRVAEKRPLPDWHPLITGDSKTVQQAGESVYGRVISEDDAGPLEHHLVNWFD